MLELLSIKEFAGGIKLAVKDHVHPLYPNGEIRHLKIHVELEWDVDSGHGGGSYVKGVKLKLIEL